MKRALCWSIAVVTLAACGSSVNISGTGGATGSTAHGGASTASSSGAGATTSSSSSGEGGAIGSIDGGSTSTSSSGSAGAGGGMVCPDYGDQCTSCLATACPPLWCACRNDDVCIALITCMGACNDAACEQMCQSAHAGAISELVLLSDCAATACISACPNNKPIGDCTKCAASTCPDALDACLAEPECVALYQCLTSCGKVDLVCQQGCYAQHGAGTTSLQALLECESGPCGPTCL